MEYSGEDIQLMLRFQNGDEACFEELVERHKKMVFSLVYRFLGDTREAEDISQEVFLSVYRARDSYKPSAKFTTWLYVICKNACLKSVRKHNPCTLSLDAPLDGRDCSFETQVVDPNAVSPADYVLASEQEAVVRSAIAGLPENQRLAVS